jgi:hypothetical protein
LVKRDGDKDISFTGELIAEAETSPETARSAYSVTTGRWVELRLYRTQGGKFICEQVGRTQWQGEHDRYSGAVCEDHAGVIEFFGNGWLAKELYEEAEISAAEEVE